MSIPLILLAGFLILSTGIASTNTAGELTDAYLDAVSAVHLTSVIMNGLVRMAAIAAGVYVVWLGHDTLVRGVRGEFEFQGKLGKLKGSTPGLLFVLLGSLTIGWALQTPVSGDLDIGGEKKTQQTKMTEPGVGGVGPGTSLPPGGTPSTRASDQPPPFIGPTQPGDFR